MTYQSYWPEAVDAHHPMSLKTVLRRGLNATAGGILQTIGHLLSGASTPYLTHDGGPDPADRSRRLLYSQDEGRDFDGDTDLSKKPENLEIEYHCTIPTDLQRKRPLLFWVKAGRGCEQ